MTIWQWYMDGKNALRVEQLCLRMGKEDIGEALDAMIAHGDRWIRIHDPERSNLNTHILIQIGYALRNKKVQELQVVDNQIMETMAYTNRETCQDLIDEITNTLAKLSSYDRWLVAARHIHKLNFTDISKALGVSKGTVRTHYLKAIERLRARENDTSQA